MARPRTTGTSNDGRCGAPLGLPGIGLPDASFIDSAAASKMREAPPTQSPCLNASLPARSICGRRSAGTRAPVPNRTST